LHQIDNWAQYSQYRELIKHKNEVKAWLAVDTAKYFNNYLTESVVTFTGELINNFLDSKGQDLSSVIRGRLYMLKDLIDVVNQLDDYDKMKRELDELEQAGYKAPGSVI
jgi:hypothetical protein